MPERNRVTPLGDVVAVPLRGAWTGNRGVVHGGPSGHEIVRSHTTTAWIVCALEYRGWVAPRWEPGRWTALFFHDEAVALAAGHRPCALCRRSAFTSYRDAVRAAQDRPALRAPDLDRRLHAERRDAATRRPRRHEGDWARLPDGVFVLDRGGPRLVLGDRTVGWTPRGYGDASARPRRGPVVVLTPATTVAALGHGYRAQVDPAALRAVGDDAGDPAGASPAGRARGHRP